MPTIGKTPLCFLITPEHHVLLYMSEINTQCKRLVCICMRNYGRVQPRKSACKQASGNMALVSILTTHLACRKSEL